MKEYPTTSAQDVKLEDANDQESQPYDADAVARLGLTPTVPRTLNRLIGLIGVNSSVVVPWPSFVFVAVLNLANGGTAGLIIDLLIGGAFMMPVYISLAEKIRKCVTTWVSYATTC
jgi:hypothetical protein